jgi:hypothetical protein
MEKKFFWALLTAILILATAYSYFNARSNTDVAGRVKKWGVRVDLAQFALADFSREETKTLAKEELAAELGETTVKLTKIETEAPQKYIQDKKFLLESLFAPTASPYPGVITNVIECPEEFKPKVAEVQNGTMYTLFAGERFNYGVCAKDLVAYYSAFGIFDCKEKGVFEIRAFSNDSREPETIVRSFACSR